MYQLIRGINICEYGYNVKYLVKWFASPLIYTKVNVNMGGPVSRYLFLCQNTRWRYHLLIHKLANRIGLEGATVKWDSRNASILKTSQSKRNIYILIKFNNYNYYIISTLNRIICSFICVMYIVIVMATFELSQCFTQVTK